MWAVHGSLNKYEQQTPSCMRKAHLFLAHGDMRWIGCHGFFSVAYQNSSIAAFQLLLHMVTSTVWLKKVLLAWQE